MGAFLLAATERGRSAEHWAAQAKVNRVQDKTEHNPFTILHLPKNSIENDSFCCFVRPLKMNNQYNRLIPLQRHNILIDRVWSEEHWL